MTHDSQYSSSADGVHQSKIAETPDEDPRGSDSGETVWVVASNYDGDLGVWPEDTDLNPTPTWDGKKTVFSHVTHSMLGGHFEAGDSIVVLFRDCALVCSVDEVVTDEDGDTDD